MHAFELFTIFVLFLWIEKRERDHEEERERDNKTENYITSPGEFVASENGSSQINGLIQNNNTTVEWNNNLNPMWTVSAP